MIQAPETKPGLIKNRRPGSGPSKGRPAFVVKLWQMVNDPSNEPYIRWMPNGKSIRVVNREAFEKTVLPQYFKHANFSSFVRQLNMYGWHKVQDINSGSMQCSDEHWQFQSPNFVRGREELLDNIVRNKGQKQSEEDDEHTDVGRLQQELDNIKSKQIMIGEDLFRMRKDNELLWNEYYQTRERYDKHSQLLDRILQFLASIYGSQGAKMLDMGPAGANPPTKRRLLTQDSSVQTPPTPSPSSDTSRSESRIREISELQALQEKLRNGTISDVKSTNVSHSPPSSASFSWSPTEAGSGSTPPDLRSPAGDVSASNQPPTTGAISDLFPELLHAKASETGLDRQGPSLGNKIDDTNESLEHIADQLGLQDASLQHIQDWISRTVPNDDNEDRGFDMGDFLVDSPPPCDGSEDDQPCRNSVILPHSGDLSKHAGQDLPDQQAVALE